MTNPLGRREWHRVESVDVPKGSMQLSSFADPVLRRVTCSCGIAFDYLTMSDVRATGHFTSAAMR